MPLAVLSFVLSFTSLLANDTSIINLRTETLPTPIGIDDTHPRFSWQMASSRIGAAQKAYRIVVSTSEEALQGGEYHCFDSGTVLSDVSIGIPYEGAALLPSTRYYWKVIVTDELGGTVESSSSWFETGLMGSGWSGASWIGSSSLGLSRYRTNFNIDYKVQIPKGSRSAVFAYSVQDEGNYIAAELNLGGKNEKPSFRVLYAVEGEERRLPQIDISDIINKQNAHSEHSLSLKVSTPGYHLKSNLVVFLDGEIIGTTQYKGGKMEITPYPGGERVHDWARLHRIGFKQPKGQKAVFSGIKISEDNWGKVLYTDPEERHEVVGDGSLSVWEPYGKVSSPMLRKSLTLNKPLRSAKLYLTSRGVYEFYINNQRVSNDYFNPGWTDYRYRIMYNSYDVTSLLSSGENALGAVLGSGWWSDLNIFTSAYVDPYGISQSLLAKLVLTYEDGSTETVVSDSSWKKFDHGPIVRSGFQFGEDYDARKEQDGWKEAPFDDSSWEAADVFEAPAVTTRIMAYQGLPIQNNITLTAVSVSEPVEGTFVYDFGQNVVGVPRLEGMKGQKRGDVITLRYAEMTYPEIIPTAPVPPYTEELYKSKRGQVYTENYRGAVSVDTYTFRGDVADGETYQPVFTDHGFRYISITGLNSSLPLESVKAVVLESVGDATCHYETSNENINKLFSNILWGQRGNFQTIPTDCPQRDERQGWTGDAQVFARTATYFSPWVEKFYERWFYSVRDNQNHDGSYFNYYPVTGQPPYGYGNDTPGWIGWMDAGVIIPYQVYMQYGDTRFLEKHYYSMERYMNYLERISKDNIQQAKGIGDHLALERTDMALTNTAYYAYDALLMSHMAKALGKTSDSKRYAALYEDIKTAFNKTFVRPEDGVTTAPSGDGGSSVVDTQTSYALPLYFGLFDDAVRDKAVSNLVSDIERHGYTLTTGFIGTPYLNPALSDNGRDDVAYRLFEQTEYPSWLYPVLQGATTMWERWNSYTIENGFGPVDMNSFNHYAYGAIGEWMFAYNLGIQRDETSPAYKHILLQPRIGGNLNYAKGGFESPYGDIRSGWEKTPEGYIYRASIPANTSATLTLPASSVEEVKVIKGSEGVTSPLFLLPEGRVVTELKSGSYEFRVEL